MVRKLLIALPLAALAGCPTGAGTDGEPVDNIRDDVPELAAADGVVLQMPEVIIPAGEDKLWCAALEWRPETDMWVNQFRPFQGEGGHHFIAFSSVSSVPDGEVWDCSDVSTMTGLDPLIVTSDINGVEIEDGFAFFIEAGTQIILQSHYVNYSQDDWRTADVGHLMFSHHPDPVQLGYLIVNDGDINIPAGAEEHHEQVACHVPEGRDYNFMMMTGHMHEMGQHMTVKTGEEADGLTTLYDIAEWEPDFRDHPPITQYASGTPMTIAGGDRVVVDCFFSNPTDHETNFPEEMCTGIGIYWPANGQHMLVCD
jgi:hypothetical protein